MLKVKILLNLLCTPLKFFNPFFTLETDNPTVIDIAAAATEFLILCMPNNGILIFLINLFFLFGKIIFKSNSDCCLNCFMFLIQKFDFISTPYV